MASIEDGVLSLATGSLPKGWFNTRNALDRTKSTLEVTWELGPTSCSDKVSGTISSLTAGNFTPDTNKPGNVNGWFWSTTADLSAYANRWNNYVRCDGSVEIQGCPEAMAGSVTVVAMSSPSECHKHKVDGRDVCIAAADPVVLHAVQDADVVETACDDDGGSCGIGQCVSACQQACNAIKDKKLQQACKKDCPCDCKLQRPAHCGVAKECLD